MLKVYRIPIPKDRLRAMPKDERVLFVLLGYASNQISMLQKLLTFAINRTPDAEARTACHRRPDADARAFNGGCLERGMGNGAHPLYRNTHGAVLFAGSRRGRTEGFRGAQTPVRRLQSPEPGPHTFRLPLPQKRRRG